MLVGGMYRPKYTGRSTFRNIVVFRIMLQVKTLTGSVYDL